MKRRLHKAYYLIPVLYIGVILFFLYLQFSAGEAFNEEAGSLSISGISSRGILIGGREIVELKVNFNELVFLFSKKTPAIAGLAGGSEKRLSIKSFNTFSDGVELSFSGNLLIRFDLIDRLGDRIELKPVIPARWSDLVSLSIPVRIGKGKFSRIEGIPLLRLDNELGSFYIALPPGSEIELDKPRLIMRTDPHGPEAAIIIEGVQDNLDPFLYWFSRDLPPLGQEEFQTRVGEFLDLAYQHWQQMGFLGKEDLEEVESAGIALFSEALYRGEYRATLRKVTSDLRRRFRLKSADYSPFLTTPYLGSLSLFMDELQNRSVSQISRITELIKESDLRVFFTPNLIRFILNHAPFSLVEEIIRLADSADLDSEGIGVLLGLLESYLEVARWVEISEATVGRVTDIITNGLLPAISRRDKGLFLVCSEAGEADLLMSIKAGCLLSRAGKTIGKPAFETIGRHLILSALGLADEAGYLPAELNMLPEKPIGGSGALAPETIYPFITERRYIPEEHPLYKWLYPGSWIWTAAQVAQIEIDPKTYRFSFSFPPGESHYLIIQGVRPLKSIKLHGKFWKTDPRYFNYSDGWFYSKSSQTLFVKLTHKIPIEEILITY